MRKALITISIATTVGISTLYTGGFTSIALAATNLEDLQRQKDQIQEKRSDVESGIKNADDKINRLQNEQEKVNAEIKRIDFEITGTNQKIRERTEEISTTKKNIEKLKEEIELLQKRIEKREEILKDRARSFQQNGGPIEYIDVVFGAQSFGDFVNRIELVSTIMNADQEILRKQQEDEKLLEKNESALEKDLNNLNMMLSELKEMKTQLTSKKSVKDKFMANLKSQEEEMENAKLDLAEEKALLEAQVSTMQRAIELEKDRQAEEARQRAEAEAAVAIRQAEAAKQANVSKSESSVKRKSNPRRSSSPSKAVSGADEKPAKQTVSTNGLWAKPASGRLTSGIGERWNAFHAGIDIANTEDVPIFSAADGVVIRSYYSSSYGNVVFISHSINGQTYTTVYAHMDSRTVSAGQVVSRGQQVGIMGNTGQSFGQHLHFELHKGPWNPSKSNAVNPLNYLPM